MGRDKARVEIAEETTLIEAVVGSLRECLGPWTAVADRGGKYDDLGIRTIADRAPHRGPLGGIARACEDVDTDYIFVIGCDRLGLSCRWVHRLADRIDGSVPAVSFVADGRREPLFAFYRTDLADRIRSEIEAGRRAVWRFLERVDAVGIEAPEGWSETVAVNTPEQLRRARERGSW